MNGVDCPECGRPVVLAGAKLCPHCGYPLLLDRQPVVPEEQHKIVYKPTGSWEDSDRTRDVPRPMAGGPMPGGPAPARGYAPTRMQVPGPRCPVCHTVNPAHRKRCEVCAQELWPGAAAPAQWMPQPPAILPPPRRRRAWWQIALLVGVPVAVMATVWSLALVL